MGITQDASTPAVAQNATASGNATATTASFSPPAGLLLVAIISVDYGGTLSSITCTDSGSHSWTQKVSNIPASTHNAGAIFELQLPPAAVGSITVSGASSGASVNGASVQTQVLVLGGAATVQTSAATGTGGSSTSQSSGSASVTTTLNGSWVVIGGAVNTPETTVTPNGNTVTITNWQDATGGDTVLSGKQASPTGTPGATAFGWSWTTASTWAFAAAEILPAFPVPHIISQYSGMF